MYNIIWEVKEIYIIYKLTHEVMKGKSYYLGLTQRYYASKKLNHTLCTTTTLHPCIHTIYACHLLQLWLGETLSSKRVVFSRHFYQIIEMQQIIGGTKYKPKGFARVDIMVTPGVKDHMTQNGPARMRDGKNSEEPCEVRSET